MEAYAFIHLFETTFMCEWRQRPLPETTSVNFGSSMTGAVCGFLRDSDPSVAGLNPGLAFWAIVRRPKGRGRVARWYDAP